MSPLEAALVVILAAAPWWWIVWREMAKLEDPAYLRAHGVVVVSNRVLQERAAPIGEYLGHPIWSTVTFMGMLYRFDRVQDRRRRDRLAPGELYIEPGLVYVTD